MATRAARPVPLAAPRRTRHEAGVLTLLRDAGPVSRAKLAEVTGLSPTTITKAVAPLINQGLVTEAVDSVGRIGRPSLTLTPVPEAVQVVGVQIGVGTIRLGTADARCNVQESLTRNFDPLLPVDEVLDLIADSIADLLNENKGAPCIGVGVGVPGPVDVNQRKIRLSVNLGWREVPVADHLESALGLPVVVDHNVRSMALAEFRYGGHNTDSLAYLYVKNGVGLGVAVRGRPFYGGSGGESYIGHTRVVPDGLPCPCGATGCLDTLVAEPYLIRALQLVTNSSRHEAIATDVLKELTAEVRSGNTQARSLQKDFVHHLADAIATVTNLFTPSLVLIGGILADAPADLVEDIEEKIKERIFPLLRDDFQLKQGPHGDTAAVAAAAAVALETLHYSPTI